MIQKRQFDTSATTPLISLDFNLSKENDMRRELNMATGIHMYMCFYASRVIAVSFFNVVTTTVDGIQVLANLKFVKTLVSYLLESINPLMKGTGTGDDDDEEREVKALQHQVSTVSRSHSTMEGKESRMQISVKVIHPLIALLEDARQMDSAALVCQVSSDSFQSPLQSSMKYRQIYLFE